MGKRKAERRQVTRRRTTSVKEVAAKAPVFSNVIAETVTVAEPAPTPGAVASPGLAPDAQPAPPTPPAPAILLPPTAADDDAYADLIGQAVGLRLDSVSREFGGDEDMRVTALKDVSIEIGPGEFVSIVGPSGCGKTTLLSMMGGLDRPTSGHVYAAGLPLGELSDSDLADYRLQRVSTIFQSFNLVPSMSVEDNVALPLTLAGVELEERRRRARHLIELVGLEGRARTRASRLSGGEQQRVAVARALANRPGLILADEPTGSLDSAAGEVILKLLAELNRRGATVVLVTHDHEVARRAHRVVRMIDGRAIELEHGKQTVRKQNPVTPPARLHWRDTLKVGLGSAGRRPLRTSLTTTGVAIGIAAMSLIVALAGGLQSALSAPALATSQLHQVVVYPAAQGPGSFDAGTLATLAGQPHVAAAWGQMAMTGTFAGGPVAGGAAVPGSLVSLPPRSQAPGNLTLSAGRLPSSDSAPEVLLTDTQAVALGFTNPADALGTAVRFSPLYGVLALPGRQSNPAANHLPLQATVVGIVPSRFMPAGASGAMVPYALAGGYWSQLAQANGWRGGEYSTVTLLADSGSAVSGLRDQVTSMGFQAMTFGDQFRGFEDLLSRLRLALLGLAIVALLLACLGIANTMYTAVLERTKEIGVIKALGARSRDVLLLFVAEAAVIGLAGGLIGTIIAVALARVGNAAVDRLTQGVTAGGLDVFRTDAWVVAAALVLAVLLSTVSGLLPALRAALQDPVKALRYE
ncbi:MAG TPA: ATP-binding cassette domain-containing protein [Candidatus Dormibacteraeota bacterium]|nr:ATP-binding cassette domain-containing protein [Candidatus Dormibacteraeota bacterium]